MTKKMVFWDLPCYQKKPCESKYNHLLNEQLFPKFQLFYVRDDSQGAFRFAPGCPSVCPSVRPSVRHALRYRVCVINSSHSCEWIFLKPCIPVVNILKMCMWVFGGARINFDRNTAF